MNDDIRDIEQIQAQRKELWNSMQAGRKAARVQRQAARLLKLEPLFSRFPVVRRLYKDTFFLAVMLVYPTAGLSFVYAIAYAFMGITKLSPWHELLAAYYLVLSLMRVDVIRTDIVMNARKKDVDGRYIWKRYFDVGVLLTIMSLVLFAAVALLTQSVGGARYTGYFIYAVAFYTVCKITAATVNLIKSWHSPTPLLSIIRRIGQADALLSVLSLQTALLAAFGDDNFDPAFWNGITGCIVCLIIMALGIGMLLRAHVHLWPGRSLMDIPFYRMAKDRAARKAAGKDGAAEGAVSDGGGTATYADNGSGEAMAGDDGGTTEGGSEADAGTTGNEAETPK